MYDHRLIEPKWQKFWKERAVFQTKKGHTQPKYYVLDMFPYPSGAGLHVGHVEGYTATDIIARYKRAKGFNVLHPMGWDSFGLPAEQYAIRTGTHPRLTTQANIDTFRRQLQAMGFSYDWSRELATSDPKYYKWTQWIFTKLYERGLAYEAELQVNFCPALGTVLANEEVENGRSKEGGHLVEKRPLRQWVLKITAYADRLLEDLQLVDWPDSLKRLQIHWIGRSEGAEVEFVIENSKEKLSVFTTCPHTLFGATYLVLAPEHPLVEKVTTPAQRAEVEAYRKRAAEETEAERTDATRPKTGVFMGAYAINPVNQERLPLWIADYVLGNYGTGAIMAVPAHDARDFAFAKAFSLPMVRVIQPEDPSVQAGDCWEGEGSLIGSAYADLDINGCKVEEAKRRIIDWLEAQKKGKRTICYKLRDWLFSRQRYWGEPFPLVHLADGSKRILGLDELPLCPPDIVDFSPTGDGKSPLAKETSWVNITDPVSGQVAFRETHTMPQWAGSCWYYLRFIDPHNELEPWDRQEESYWMPVDLYVGGVEHAVLHLLYARFWHKVLYDCGLVSTTEPFWTLRNQGLIVARSFQKEGGSYVSPEEVVERHGDYFHRITGEKLRSQIEKMSKSKLNGVTPDDLIQELGADALRLYEMFMGPLEKEKIWNSDAVQGSSRFLSRFYDMATSNKVCEELDDTAARLVHRLIDAVDRDTASLQFNTAIAKMMEFLNDFTKLERYPRALLLKVVQLLAPYAPHLAEELWERLGGEGLLAYAAFPQADPRYLVRTQATYALQVNGKLRATVELPMGLDQKAVVEAAIALPSIAKYLEGKEAPRMIFVPNKLLNMVIT